MTSGVIKPKPGESRDVVTGDHVYYRHPEHGMQHGEVCAVGKDGFKTRHAREGGGTDAVPWAAMLGHKLRRQRRFTLVSRGEDGAIVHDEDGVQAFLRNDGSAPLAKSFDAGPPLAPQPLLLAPQPSDDGIRVLALELARAQAESTNMLAGAIDRMTQAVLAQCSRLDTLIALQVAALNSGDSHVHEGSVFQEHQSAAGHGSQAGPAGIVGIEPVA